MYEATEFVMSKFKQVKTIPQATINKMEDIIKYGPFLNYSSYSDPSLLTDWLRKRNDKYREDLIKDNHYNVFKEHLSGFADTLEKKEVVGYDEAHGCLYTDTYKCLYIWILKSGYNSPYTLLIISSFVQNNYTASIVEIDKINDVIIYLTGLNVLGGLKIMEMWCDLAYYIKYHDWKNIIKDWTSWDGLNLKEPVGGKIIKQHKFTCEIDFNKPIEKPIIKITSSSSDYYKYFDNYKYNLFHD